MQIIILHNFTYKLKVNLTNKKNVYLETTIQNQHLTLVLLKKTDLIGSDLNLICQIRSNISDLQFRFSSKKF